MSNSDYNTKTQENIISIIDARAFFEQFSKDRDALVYKLKNEEGKTFEEIGKDPRVIAATGKPLTRQRVERLYARHERRCKTLNNN